MLHRHINHQGFTLSAIDDLIARGGRADWIELREALRRDDSLRQKICQVCEEKVADPYAQRYHFWNHYVQKR